MLTAYLFPGQGSQSVGMGKAWYEAEPSARAVYEQADELLGFALSTLCFEGPEDELTDTVNQQPALFVTSLAAWQLIQEKDWPKADFVAGHSLGELSALTAAGSLSFADGLALVRKRGELMKAAGERKPGAMAAILGLDASQVESICQEASAETGHPVQLANDNCPGQIVISGDKVALEKASELCQAAKARKVVTLPITIAAHSALMASAAHDFTQAILATDIQPPSIPVIANVSGQPLTTVDAIQKELTDQLTGSVQWTSSMQYLRQQGVDTFIEVGPSDVLTKLMKRIDRKATRKKFEI